MNKVLLNGIQKVGNTWTRFVIFNYYHIKNHGATKTLNFDELEAPHLLRVIKGIDYPYADGFPLVFHTHLTYTGYGIFDTDYHPKHHYYFDSFDKKIYLYRNPFDTMISYYYFMMFRTTPEPFGAGVTKEELKKMKNIDGFTEFYLPRWIRHVKTTMHRCDLVLDYDKLREDPSGFWDALELLDDGEIDEDIFWKAIEMSSFESIKYMSEKTKQVGGLGMPYLKGYFCRDGRSEQYKEVMKAGLIDYIKDECKRNGIEI